MGKRQSVLKRIIHRNFPLYDHPKPNFIEFKKSQYWHTIERIYQSLSGKMSEAPTHFGTWDISTEHFIIELDEERHFNRYRCDTLTASLYSNEENFSVSAYIKYCDMYEAECLKSARWKNNWKNDSSEKLFGFSNNEGNLADGGSSRWKQRAYNDFLRDVASRIMNIPVFRLSIYDMFNGETVHSLLFNEKERQVLNLLRERAEQAKNLI